LPGPARKPLRATRFVGVLLRFYEEQLTARGRYLLWTTMVFALLGLDTRRSRVFVLFSLCAAAFLIAWAFTRLRRPRVRFECELPARATAGRPVAFSARLSSEVGRSVPDVRVQFRRPIRWGTSIGFEPGETCLDVPGNESLELKVRLDPKRRGRYELRGPTLRAVDPLGLAVGPARTLPGQALLVYPRFWSMESFMVPLGRRYQPGGIPLSSSTGDAIEFVGTREYREGDPLKNIHWRSWARRGQPVVKEYQEEYFCRIALILDTFVSARRRPQDLANFEAAVSVVASIADFFSRGEYIVDILAAGPDVYEVSAGRSLAYLENILDVLACLEPCPEPPFQSIGPHLFDKLQQTTTVVAVLQDWDAPRRDFLRRVKALGTAVKAIVVREGSSSLDWRGAADDLGEISQMSPADVDRATSTEAVRG